MALQFILGSSGQGKSTWLQKQILQKAKMHPEQNFLYLVPEQFTMETQKELVAMSPGGGILNVDVLSFLRLAYRVFSEEGSFETPILDDLGKVMVLRKLLGENADKLSYFRANISKKGYISELKSFLSELFQYSVDADTLENMQAAAKDKPLLQAKLKDMQVVYDRFRDYLSGHYVVAEDLLEILSDKAPSSRLLAHSTICLDGFTGFTPGQYALLRVLLHCCEDVYIILTIDQAEDIMAKDHPHDLFHLSRHTIQKLYKMAATEDITVVPPYYPALHESGCCHRFCHSPALAALEKSLYRYPFHPFKETTDDIQIHVLQNPSLEVDTALWQIKELLLQENFRYRDIAIITGDISTYGPLIQKSSERCGLPCFIDQKKNMLGNPLVEQLLALLELLLKNWDYDSVLGYMRAPLSSFSSDETDLFENYILAYGIKGKKRYRTEFTKTPKGRCKDETLLAMHLQTINEIRERLVAELESLQPFSSGRHSVKEITTALHSYMLSQNLYHKVNEMKEHFALLGDALSVKEYEQIYDITLGVLDRLVELLGEEELYTKEYNELLHTGFSEARVGLIPPGIDQIVVGDITRSRLSHVKVLFLLGVNDGNIPKMNGSGGILSDVERSYLAEQDFSLAPTTRENAYTEQFYLYLTLTKPSHKLYLSYARTDLEGKTLLPSYLIKKICQIFPGIKLQTRPTPEDLLTEKETNFSALLGTDRGLSALITGLRRYEPDKMPPAWMELYRYYLDRKDTPLLYHLKQGALYHETKSSIGKEAAHYLYGDNLVGSVSRLERFAACAFAHFLTYGLRLQEREEFMVRMPDYGNIMHEALEIFTRSMYDKGLDWNTLPENERVRLSEDAIIQAGEGYGSGMLLETHRSSYLLTRMKHMMNCTTWALTQQMKLGSFTTSGYELSFYQLGNLSSTALSLDSDGHELSLTGRIDRIDTCEDENHVYVKVIDYKTGDKNFEITDLQHGLQMQLVVYLDAAMELAAKKHPDKEIVPAGIYYYKLQDPIPEIAPDIHLTAEEALAAYQKEILAMLRMDGLTNMDDPVIPLLDHNFDDGSGQLLPSTKSKVAYLESKKDGTLKSYSQATDTHSLLTYIRENKELMASMGLAILDGETAVYPYRKKNQSACDYCGYRNICRFDPKAEGCNYHDL